jgi:hypothetical protein
MCYKNATDPITYCTFQLIPNPKGEIREYIKETGMFFIDGENYSIKLKIASFHHGHQDAQPSSQSAQDSDR